jgi:hypothetical protein
VAGIAPASPRATNAPLVVCTKAYAIVLVFAAATAASAIQFASSWYDAARRPLGLAPTERLVALVWRE